MKRRKQTRKECAISAKLNMRTATKTLMQMNDEARKENKSVNSPEIIRARQKLQFWTDELFRHSLGLKLGY